MNAQRRQGLFFVTAAFLLSGYHVLIGVPSGINTLFFLLLLIIFLGIPHGALDTLYAGRVFGIRRPSHWFLFTLAYLLPVVLVMFLWPYWSGFLLLLFLAISVLHFSGDPEPDCPLWLRILYGGSPVVLPALLHGTEVERLFAALVPTGVAASFHAVLAFLALPWLLALALAAVIFARSHRRGAIELAAVGTLCTLVPPLVSFTLFFCGMHSARHILRSVRDNDANSSPSRYIIGRAAVVGLPPMIATLAILAVYWESATNSAVEPRLIQTVFVTLLALTFPHVILVDCFYRWRTSVPPGGNPLSISRPVIFR